MKKNLLMSFAMFLLAICAYTEEPESKNMPTVIHADISCFPLNARLDEVGLHSSAIHQCYVWVPPVFFSQYFVVQDDDIHYTVAFKNDRIIYIGVEGLDESLSPCNSAFVTPEGAYLGMPYKKCRRLFRKKKMVHIKSDGYYAKLKSGWIVAFPETDFSRGDAVIECIFKDSLFKL